MTTITKLMSIEDLEKMMTIESDGSEADYAVQKLGEQLLDTMRENERLREALKDALAVIEGETARSTWEDNENHFRMRQLLASCKHRLDSE